jgi:transglutaminase-like putative cysteine protease/signal transduction histidine kinase
MAVVPMAWAPARVPDAVGQRARISETGSVLLDRPVPTNSTVRVVSRVRSPDPERLRRAGTDYPRALERTYTALPSSVPDRVEARTAEIAADAETPYATAVAIERYLEGSKTYSLEVSRPAGNVADAFLFEMDRGYCQYFATTMVVMLRTQGIPARYVTGFTPGQPVGEDTYVVRGMNAHAWVEVYFPDVGWVQFDPTPGGPRTDLEREAIEQARAQGLANVDAKGSRGEPLSFPSENASSPGESSGSKNPSKGSGSDDGESSDDSEGDGSEDNGSDRESDEKDATEPIRVDVHPDPVPGRVVTVTVTRGGDPVSGAVVRFNEETIGTTDGNGTVSGRVPYVRTLNVTVVPPDAVSQKPLSSRVVASGAGSSPVPDRWYSLEPPSIAAQPNRNSSKAPRATGGALAAGPAVHEVADNGTNTTTYELDTTIYLTVEDDLVPGRTVVFDATIDDVPVANARVVVDGQRRGRTNETGRIPVELPYRSNVTVRITRGAAELNRSISLRSGVDIDLRRPVAGTTRNLSATVGERPLRNATVRLDGERVGRTNATGSLPVSIPYRKNVTLAVSRGGLGTERNVSVEGDLSLEASGDVLPTREIRIDATLGGHPVGNATVSLDGTPTTRTNATGAASVVFPYEKNVTVTVRRGEFVENRTVRVDEPLSLSISGEWLPSRTVTLSATIGDVSVDNATVALDGTLTTRTNATGAASVVVPYRKNVTVTVRRGEFATSRTMRVEESLSLSLSGRKLPTRPITLDATIGGVPVRNATVAIGGDRAGVTGSNGEKTVSLPLANSVTIVVSRGEFGAETTLEWLLLPIALPVVALALLVGAWVAARRRGVSERLHPAWWGRLVALRALSALVFLSEFVARALALGSGLVDKLRRSFRQLLAAVRRAPTLRARLAVLADSVGRVAATLRRRLRHLLAAIREVDPTALLAAVSRLRSSGTAVSAPDGRRNSPVVAGESTGNDADQSFDVVAAWMWVEARSGVRDRRTKTPGEIAREAATRGWPRDSVETLLRAYRNVTYADRSLEPGHRSRARRAFERISSRRGTDVNERANAADNAEDGLEGGDRS